MKIGDPFIATFVDRESRLFLELTNTAGQTLRSVEILTIFLANEEFPGAPSRAHIKFETIRSIQPGEKAAVSHRTWIDGKPVEPDRDQLGRLRVPVVGVSPHVLDISWENAEGNSRFQRITVGT